MVRSIKMGAVGTGSDACAGAGKSSAPGQDGGRVSTRPGVVGLAFAVVGAGGGVGDDDYDDDDDVSAAYSSWRFWKEPLPRCDVLASGEDLVKRWWVESQETRVCHDDDDDVEDVEDGDEEDVLSGSIVVIDPRSPEILPTTTGTTGGFSSSTFIQNLRPISNFFRSIRRSMGNLQGSGDGKSRGGGRSPGKAKKGNKKEQAAKRSAPKKQQQQQKGGGSVGGGSVGGGVGEEEARPPTYLVTDSWRRANRQQLTPASRESSSESVFTDPLTPHSGQLSDGDMVSGRQPGAVDVDEVTLTLVEEPSTDHSEASSAVFVAEPPPPQQPPPEQQQQQQQQQQPRPRPQSHSLDALDEEAATTTPAAPGDRSRSADELDDDSSPAPGSAAAPRQQPPPSFTVVRHRKVELNPTRLSEHCLASGLSTQQQQQQQQSDKEARDARRHSSVSDAPLDSNVLRKVASLTLDKATLEQKVVRPRFVPEKLDFQIYEKFEGQMLINWFVSSFAEEHYLRVILTSQDMRILAVQFCTHLLAAGVLRQIPDKDVPLETMFRPDLMYFWSHAEAPLAAPPTPGRLSQLSWPPASPGLPDLSSLVAPPACSPGAKYTEAEFQQVVMGMKREHKENLKRLSNSQEVSLFSLRGEIAQRLDEKDDRIAQLELELEKLMRELDRYKTLADIESLNANAAADFGSPTAEQKRFLREAQKPLVSHTSKEELRFSSAEGVAGTVPKVAMIDVATDTTDLISVQNVNTSMSPQAKSATATQTTLEESSSSALTFSTISTQSVELKLANAEHGRTSTLPAATGNEIHRGEAEQGPYPTSELRRVIAPSPVQQAVDGDSSPSPAVGPPDSQVVVSPPTQKPDHETPPPPVLDTGPPEPSAAASPPPSKSPSMVPPPPPPMSGMDPPPPPPMSGMSLPPQPPPMSGMSLPPPPPPMSGMGPQPPPMSGMGPPPPPMPGMGPPPPPMPGMGPPPPPMPGMGPPPPPPPTPQQGTGASGPLPPPVPGMGPMPFPAPPVGGWAANRAMLRKKPLAPPVPMKPLYWTRIVVPATAPETTADSTDGAKADGDPARSEGSALWERLEEASIEDMKEFEELFSRQVVERRAPRRREERPARQQAAKILDGKRSQSVGILASSLHVEFSEIENAIYNFDTSAVNLEALQQIYDVRATEEELSAIRSHVASNPDAPLDKPEQFLYELAEIPMFAFRISCFMFQSQFDDSVCSIESKLNNLRSTCEFLTTAESLKVVLAIILALGNYMNGGNRTRGQADGFGLEILARLKDVKSKDSSVTLLHFIVRTYIKKTCDGSSLDPNLALPTPEPGDIDRAGSVNFEDLKNDLDKLKSELKTCETKTEKVIAASNEDNVQPFKEKMEAFLKRANDQLTGEFAHLQECKQKFITTMEFYQYQPKGGIKPDELDPKEFFALWSQFCTDFKDIWKKEQQRIIKEKTQQVKRLQEQRRDVKKSKLDEKGLKAKIQRKFK
ncbi:protein cappuccino isoform X2 [Bacillus rossius redtenbacheri]|uniref:protein cappuccino isoform X2 n=1 Tax=Bacillus rossius redtenbacheri TaxID=93214 RepID=UPI002FDE58FA